MHSKEKTLRSSCVAFERWDKAMKEVIIMRGLPGSGKSTWARDHAQKKYADGFTWAICSADAFFENRSFDPRMLPVAHKECRDKFESALRERVDTVIVDNTNTTETELAWYHETGLCAGYDVKIVEVSCDPETSFARNVHNVPWKTIERMNSNLSKPLKGEYNVVRA